MAELNPYPFAALIRRMFAELKARDAIFDLPRRKFHLGDPDHDTSVRLHGHRASAPLGPAAGPQSQMAQNLVLAWLGGCRIFELKTVQILDELKIPRPCIDMQTIGFNVEWSQELELQQSLEEYVKGAMLIRILEASGELEVAPGFGDVIYDMSVGYDLKGIQSAPVRAFIDGMMDCSEVVERLRAQIPPEFERFRDLDFQARLADTLTLSTFHGCPPDEIESIVDFLLREVGLHCIVKLNPTLLGPDRVRELLHDAMGYHECRVPDAAFEKDTSWEQAQGFVERLGATAEAHGLSFGVKFTNTLIVENHRDFFPAEEKEMYLSGPPLHVLAMHLVQRFRRRFGDRYPVSFSAGIDRKNYADAVALGLTPITVCSDLLLPGGYARASTYHRELAKRMDAVGASHTADYILQAFDQAEPAIAAADLTEDGRKRCRDALASGASDLREAVGDEAAYQAWVSAAKLLNTEVYVATLPEDPRYGKAKNSKPPRKIGSMLELFDCVTCDKCVPVCPNDANFTLLIEPKTLPVEKAAPTDDGGLRVRRDDTLTLEMKHQIANFADFCNECGNCDVFCPEDGGPYVLKPRFFGTLEQWRTYPDHDGFYLERSAEGEDRMWARFEGREVTLRVAGEEATYAGEGFEVSFRTGRAAETLSGRAEGEVDLTWAHIMDEVRRAVFDSGDVNYVNALSP